MVCVLVVACMHSLKSWLQTPKDAAVAYRRDAVEAVQALDRAFTSWFTNMESDFQTDQIEVQNAAIRDLTAGDGTFPCAPFFYLLQHHLHAHGALPKVTKQER